MAETDKDRSAQQGAVTYPDGSVLLRPQEIHGPYLIVAGVLLVAAIVIGVFMVNTVSTKVIYASDAAKSEITAEINKVSSLAPPVLSSYAAYGDDDLIAALQAAGYAMVMIPQTSESVNSVDVASVSDTSKDMDVAAFYSNDGSGFSTLDKVKVLNNTWRLTVNRSSGTVLRLRFADFTSTSVEAAISKAMQQQGFSDESATGLATDDSKNTYREGVVSTDDDTMRWRVSAIDLSEVYSVSGLPNDAYYVGVRLEIV